MTHGADERHVPTFAQGRRRGEPRPYGFWDPILDVLVDGSFFLLLFIGITFVGLTVPISRTMNMVLVVLAALMPFVVGIGGTLLVFFGGIRIWPIRNRAAGMAICILTGAGYIALGLWLMATH